MRQYEDDPAGLLARDLAMDRDQNKDLGRLAMLVPLICLALLMAASWLTAYAMKAL